MPAGQPSSESTRAVTPPPAAEAPQEPTPGPAPEPAQSPPRGSIGAIELGLDRPGMAAGMALKLDRPAAVGFVSGTTSGAEVQFTAGSDIVVCRLPGDLALPTTSAEVTFGQAYPAVQEALDLFGARWSRWHDIPEGWGSHLLWWSEAGRGVIARWVDFTPTTLRTEAWYTVTKADGTLHRSQDEPPGQWREALRYLRYSQTTTDLYDAYRTAYLALESLLSSIHPKTESTERAWTLAALADLVVAGVDLKTFVDPVSTDPVQAFYDEQYKANRCAHDHAKLSAARFLPGTAGDREQVSSALLSLAGLVNHAIGVIDGGGSGVGMTMLAGIELYAKLMEHMTLHVTADATPVDASDTVISPAGLPTTALTTRFLGVVDSVGYDYGWLGESAVQDLASTLVSRTAATVPTEQTDPASEPFLYMAGNLPTLELGGVDVFQYATRLLWSESGGLRRHYPRS